MAIALQIQSVRSAKSGPGKSPDEIPVPDRQPEIEPAAPPEIEPDQPPELPPDHPPEIVPDTTPEISPPTTPELFVLRH